MMCHNCSSNNQEYMQSRSHNNPLTVYSWKALESFFQQYFPQVKILVIKTKLYIVWYMLCQLLKLKHHVLIIIGKQPTILFTHDGISISKKVSSAMYNFYENCLRFPMYLI